YKSVLPSVSIAVNQVAGQRVKGHITAVCRDGGARGDAISCRSVGGYRDERGLACLPVMHEDAHKGEADGPQVAGPRVKGHVAAVRGDGRVFGRLIPLRPIGGYRDAGGLARLPVAHEDVTF